MRFVELDLPGVWVIEPTVFEDARGAFWRDFCADEFAARGLATTAVQGNISHNPTRGTLRGFHYQIGKSAEAKTMACLSGALHDIVVDLRRDSPTFLRWIAVDISAADRRSLHVPAGCANAWLSTEPQTILHYYMSERYAPDSYRGFRYDDPMFGFRWPGSPTVISDKDRLAPDFDVTSFDRA